jgi:hypothetical protein
LQALRDSVVRTGSNNTQPLIDALAPLGQYGLSPQEAAVIAFGRFPVAGKANYTHDGGSPASAPPGACTRAPTSSPRWERR